MAVRANWTRVQNTAAEQTVRASPGQLHRIILSNSGAAATLTLKDGATTMQVLNVPANTAAPVSLDMGPLKFATSLKVTASATSVDALFIT